MSFYPLFISLTCGKDCEIDLQADIFISIPVLCQRSVQITAFWRRSPSETDTGCQAARGAEAALRAAPSPHTRALPAHTAQDPAMKRQTTAEIRQQKCAPQAPATIPAAEVTPAQGENNWNFSEWQLSPLMPDLSLSLNSFFKTCWKWNKTSSPKFRTTSVCLKEIEDSSAYNTDQGKSNGLLHKAYPFTIHLYKPRTARSLFITWLHSSSIAGNHYHSMITKNNI